MADIAELGYSVDSSGLVAGTKALDDNAAAADRAGGAAERLEREYSGMARAIQQSTSVLGDRLGGALDRIGTGTGAVITELQILNRTQSEVLAALTQVDAKLNGTSAGLQAYGRAGREAADGVAEAATASQRLEEQLAQQESRLREVARRGVEWAESSREANLSERALAEAARDAASGIDVKGRALAGAASEQERLAARAQAMEAAEERAAAQAREAARAAELQKLNLRELLGQIDPTIAALQRLADMEDRLERANGLGALDDRALEHYRSQIESSRQAVLEGRRSIDGLTNSAAQNAHAMRMVPMQITDFTTSVISGQPVWMAAIQQGGQLIDMFDDVGSAASAVGTAILGMINPVSISAVVIGALVVASSNAESQLLSFQRALLLAGHGSDVTQAQFQGLVGQLDALVGVTRGQAVTALTTVAASGRIAGEQFAMVAEAAARMEGATGRAASETVSAFERIAKDPVDALVDLNDAENFLNRAQIQRIMTLKDEGREQQAVAEAMALYDQHLDDVADKANAQMPVISKWWRDVKDDVQGAWGELQTYSNLLAQIIQQHTSFSLSGAGQSSLLNAAGPAGLIAQLIPDDWASTVNEQMKAGLARLSGSAGPMPVFESVPDARRDIEAYAKSLEDTEEQQKSASAALEARLSGIDRESAKLAARNKIIELYNKLADNDSRHFDGSMQRLMAESDADIDKRFNRESGIGKANADDNATQSFIANIQRQITANEQLAASGDKLTSSDRLMIQARQMLADKTSTMTGASRKLLEALLPQLESTDALAQAEVERQRGMQASVALTERLAQLEQQRRNQADVDLASFGIGRDATQILQRQLDIQRQYLDEQEKLDRTYNRDRSTLSAEAAAVREAQYAQDTLKLKTSLDASLEIERNYQRQRMAALGDWRVGFSSAWADYAFSAANASEQAASLLVNGLSTAEDAFVRFVQTGKLSFTDLANSIIADLARIAARQAIVGMIGSIAGGFAGSTAGAWSGTSAGAGSSLNFGNNVDSFTGNSWASYGVGRAGGGQTYGSAMHEVGEYGRPEVFTDEQGRNYLLPGNRGSVTPIASAPVASGGGSGTPVFNTSIVIQSDGTSNTQSTQQNSTEATRQLQRSMEGMMNDWWVKQTRPGGAVHAITRGR